VDNELLQTFRFRITLTPSPSTRGAPICVDGGFSECSGLQLEADVREYQEGGRNDGVIRRVGRVKLSPLVLKRGMFITGKGEVDMQLWNWLTSMVSGALPVARYDGEIRVDDPSGARPLARWSFSRGLPMKVSGPTLNAKNGEIAVEEVTIAHEGLRLGMEPAQ
jgi:phage tail-like protein